MRDASVFQHARVEPFTDQSDQHSVAHPSLEQLTQMAVVDRIERLSNMMPPSRTRLRSIPK
jgi:hypothetical protein